MQSHYGDDWWFTGFHAMALLEDGQFAAAGPVVDIALRGNPNSAGAAHSRGHLAYEAGDVEGAPTFPQSVACAVPAERSVARPRVLAPRPDRTGCG